MFNTNSLEVSTQFAFSMTIALGVCDFLRIYTAGDTFIKWPNDLILKNKKICGMLFEKKGDFLIGGIGINILQENFEKLPKAGSIFTQTQLKFEAKEFANSFHHYLFENLIHLFVIVIEHSDIHIF